MLTVFVVVAVLIVPAVKAQFLLQGPAGLSLQNLFGPSGGSASSGCSAASVSCLPAPWCSRRLDDKGCTICQCLSGLNPSGNPAASGQGSGNLGPAVSPFSVFGPSIGGQVSGIPGFPTGNINPLLVLFGLVNTSSSAAGKNNCPPEPYTCPVPPPWCQRIVDTDGCVKCICGSDLQEYMARMNGLIIPASSASTNGVIAGGAATATPTSCPKAFSCSLQCPQGFQKEASGCPLCACAGTTVSSNSSPLTKSTMPASGTVDCGVFDCDKDCIHGYKSDATKCPLCECN